MLFLVTMEGAERASVHEIHCDGRGVTENSMTPFGERRLVGGGRWSVVVSSVEGAVQFFRAVVSWRSQRHSLGAAQGHT